MSKKESLPQVAPLEPADAVAVRALLVAGLTERWGSYEPGFNPDIEALPDGPPGAVTLVAKIAGEVVGTGTLRPLGPKRSEIVRMSVAAAHRRSGIGRELLAALLAAARARGVEEIVLETSSDWTSAIAFYESCGFRKTHEKDGDTYFLLEIHPS